MGMQCQCQVHRLCFERSSPDMYIYKELFAKTFSPKFALALQTRFLDWRLSHFGKEFLILNRLLYNLSYFSLKQPLAG